MAQALATTDLQAEHDRIRAEAVRLAEGAGDIPGRPQGARGGRQVRLPRVRSYELAEDAGCPRLGEAIRYHGVLPSRFFDDPSAYADGLRETN